MLFISKKRRLTILGVSTVALLALSACSMNDKIEAKIEENKINKEGNTESKKSSEETFDKDVISDEEFQLSKEQKKIIDESKTQSGEDALKNNELDTRKEISTNVPNAKEYYASPNEFSQYIGNIIYKYHSNQFNGSEYYTHLKNYISTSFNNQLPKRDSERIQMFEQLQSLFQEQIQSEIVSYQVTELVVNQRAKEASFYRKYTLKNGEMIYYETTIIKLCNKWLLLDDRPSAGYLVENTNKKLIDVDSKEE